MRQRLEMRRSTRSNLGFIYNDRVIVVAAVQVPSTVSFQGYGPTVPCVRDVCRSTELPLAPITTLSPLPSK